MTLLVEKYTYVNVKLVQVNTERLLANILHELSLNKNAFQYDAYRPLLWFRGRGRVGYPTPDTLPPERPWDQGSWRDLAPEIPSPPPSPR